MSGPKDLVLPPLPCPECGMNQVPGTRRIGGNRARCRMCNNFAQAVLRLTRKELIRRTPPEVYEAIRLKVELDLYPQVMEEHQRLNLD